MLQFRRKKANVIQIAIGAKFQFQSIEGWYDNIIQDSKIQNHFTIGSAPIQMFFPLQYKHVYTNSQRMKGVQLAPI